MRRFISMYLSCMLVLTLFFTNVYAKDENIYSEIINSNLYLEYNRDTKELFIYGTGIIPGNPGTVRSAKKLYIGEGITGFEILTFSRWGELEEVYLPETITSISPMGVFSECTNLVKIDIPKSVTSIGYNAFMGCASLEEIIIPENVTTIELQAFQGCISLKEINIPESVTSIGVGAFQGCTSLEKINIPESVTSIGAGAFQGCTSLEKINIPEKVTSIGGRLFYGCTSLEKITIPESVTSIGGSAFFECKSLKEITIPKSVTIIGEDAFNGCISLEKINIPEKVSTIGNKAFKGCYSLENISISENVSTIGSEAFSGCSSFNEMNIPKSVKTIGDSVFENCSNLKELTLYSSAESVGDSITDGIDKISILSTDEDTALDFNASGLNAKEIYIEDGVTYIGDGAFKGNTTIEKIHIPSSVTRIEYNAFSGCTNMVIEAEEGSYAQTFATLLGIPFEKIESSNEGNNNQNENKDVEEHKHEYSVKTTPATFDKDGLVVTSCDGCNSILSKQVIKAIGMVELEEDEFVYDGKTKKPEVVVNDVKGNVVDSKYYNATYSNNTNIGDATVKVVFKGNYTGTTTLKFLINPKAPSIKKVKAMKKGFSIKYSKSKGGVNGYQICYSTSAKFKKAKKVSIKKLSTKLKKLKKKTKYFIKVRSYKVVGGVTYYSDWSKVKKVKTK